MHGIVQMEVLIIVLALAAIFAAVLVALALHDARS
jgi:hypothetical protein